MVFRKMVTMTLYARQQKRHRCKEQTFGLCGRRWGWDDLREQHWHVHYQMWTRWPGKNTGVGCHFLLQCMKVKSESEVTQSCLTLCDPMDCSLPGFSVHGIFQARVLEWVAIAFSDSWTTYTFFYNQSAVPNLASCFSPGFTPYRNLPVKIPTTIPGIVKSNIERTPSHLTLLTVDLGRIYGKISCILEDTG